jgi:hypothetical protein
MLTPGSLPRVLPRRSRSRIIRMPSVAMMTIRMQLLIYFTTTSINTGTSCSVVVVTALSLSSVSVQMNQNQAAGGRSSALNQQVQWLGTRVSQKEEEYEQEMDFDDEVVGTGQATQELQRIQKKQTESPFKERQVWQALANLEKDSTYISYCI